MNEDDAIAIGRDRGQGCFEGLLEPGEREIDGELKDAWERARRARQVHHRGPAREEPPRRGQADTPAGTGDDEKVAHDERHSTRADCPGPENTRTATALTPCAGSPDTSATTASSR